MEVWKYTKVLIFLWRHTTVSEDACSLGSYGDLIYWFLSGKLLQVSVAQVLSTKQKEIILSTQLHISKTPPIPGQW